MSLLVKFNDVSSYATEGLLVENCDIHFIFEIIFLNLVIKAFSPSMVGIYNVFGKYNRFLKIFFQRSCYLFKMHPNDFTLQIVKFAGGFIYRDISSN